MRRAALCFIPSILAGAAFVHPTTRALLGEVVEDVVRQARGDRPSLGPPQAERRPQAPDEAALVDDPDLAPDTLAPRAATAAPTVAAVPPRDANSSANAAATEPGAVATRAAEPEAPALDVARAKPVGPRIASRAREAWVFAGPTWSSRRLGYVRAGLGRGGVRA